MKNDSPYANECKCLLRGLEQIAIQIQLHYHLPSFSRETHCHAMPHILFLLNAV